MRIVFFGTPHFAVASLKVLHEADLNIVGVVTATDKYGGRGKKQLIESDIKKYCLEHNLTILQPKNLKAASFVEELKKLKADIQVVVAFRMLPEIVWNMPPMGTINLHGSLLPKYRGAAPINWAIIKGEKETGVTTFKLKHAIDTGNILLQSKINIPEDATFGEMYEKMMNVGADLLLQTIEGLANNELAEKPQDLSLVSKAPKIYPEMCRVNFHQTSFDVHNFIRGLSPFPCAWINMDGLKLKIYSSSINNNTHDVMPGTIISDQKSFLLIATKNGFLNILDLQLQGKKRMKTRAFLNGYTIQQNNLYL